MYELQGTHGTQSAQRPALVSLTPADERSDLACGFRMHAGDHVGVLREREGGGLVAEALADYLHRLAGSPRHAAA